MSRSSEASVRGWWRQALIEPRRPAWVRASQSAPWYVVGTVCIGAFMGQLDASIVTLALPTLGRDLHAPVGVVEWVALAYMLVLVATVATVGRVADAIGRKLLYVYGFGVFTAGSLLCGVAPTLAFLIAARVLQAVGAAMLQANSVALIAEALPRRLLARGIGVQGTAQALGLAFGPTVGGALLAVGGWRLIFWVNIPAGVIGLVLGWFLLPRSRSHRELGRVDALGALLLALAAAGPLVFISLASGAGYASPALLAALALGVLAGFVFVRHECRVPDPLIEPSMFRRPALSVGLSSGLVSYAVLFGTLFVVPYFLITDHTGPVVVGLQLSTLPIAIGITAPLVGRLGGRVGHTLLSGGCLVLTAVGLLVAAVAHQTVGLLAGLALAGVGLGAFTPTNNATIMSAAAPGHAGVVSGVLNMTRGMGAALGVAVTSAVYTASAATGSRHPDPARGVTVALGALGLVALLVGVALLRRTPTKTANESAQSVTPTAEEVHL